MKKLLLLSIFVCSPVFAGTISISPFISNNDVTIARLETQRTTISNVINGNIEGGTNIKAGSLVSQDFSSSVSPVTRWDEAFNDFTYEGMLPATSADLTSNISAGTSYVSGFRVVIGTTAHTYSASKDTYVYVNKGGFYNYDPVANGAAAPTNYTSANGNLLLAVVITSGTAITTVTDMRTTGISLASGEGLVPLNYRDEFRCSWASTSTITVSIGILEVNGVKIAPTTATTLNLATASNWAGGASLRAVSTYGYIGVDASGNIKMHTTAPTHSNYDLSVTTGKKRYASWSGTTYRIIAWFYMNATGSGELNNSWGVSNIAENGVPNIVSLINTTIDTVNDTTFGSDLTGTSTEFYTSGGMVTIRGSVSADNTGASAIDQIDLILNDGSDISNSSYSATSPNSAAFSIYPNYTTQYSQGTKTFSMKMKVSSNSVSVPLKNLTIEER